MPEKREAKLYEEAGGDWRDAIWGNAESKGNATNYQYRDADLEIIWVTNVPKSDLSAVRYFHTLVGWDFEPVYVEKKGPEDAEYEMMPWRFNNETMQAIKIGND